MAPRISAQSSAVRARGPILSSDGESTIEPFTLTRPCRGRNRVIPQCDEGHRIEPQVSEPSANAASPAETIAPEPDDEPQVQRFGSHGFFAPPVSDAVGKR